MPGAGATLLRSLSAPRVFRRHFGLFLTVNAILTVANIVGGAPWWAFWPLLIWGVPLGVHYLYYKASAIDDDWVEARMEDLRSKSYDLSHIDDIKKKPAGAGPERGLGEPPG